MGQIAFTSISIGSQRSQVVNQAFMYAREILSSVSRGFVYIQLLGGIDIFLKLVCLNIAQQEDSIILANLSYKLYLCNCKI